MQEYYRNLCEDEKIKIRNYAYIGNKYMWGADRKSKKGIQGIQKDKLLLLKKKNLTYLIICAEEFENASLNKKSGNLSHKNFWYFQNMQRESKDLLFEIFVFLST